MKSGIKYEEIYKDILNKILNATYSAGERLPAESELQQIYSVSRITVQKAMNMLAEAGYIIRFPGRGSFVNEKIGEILQKEEEKAMLTGNYGALGLAGNENTGLQNNRNINRRIRVGVIFDAFSYDFGIHLLRSIERECVKRNYDMFFRCTYGNVAEETKAIECALRLEVNGLIIMCAQGEMYNKTILSLSLNQFPMVLVDRSINGVQIPCIKTDNYTAATELTEVLANMGHEKIGFLTHSILSTSTIHERYRGFTDYLFLHPDISGFLANIENYDTTDSEHTGEGYEEILRVNEDCTAYLAAEYKIACQMEATAKRLGKKIDLVTFDCVDSPAKEAAPFIHVRQGETEMGQKAVETLQKLINGQECETNILIPHKMIMN